MHPSPLQGRPAPHRPHSSNHPPLCLRVGQRPPALQELHQQEEEEGESGQGSGRGHGRGGGQMTNCGELRVIEVCRYFARVKYLYICFHCESLFHCTPLYILKV